MNLGELKSFIDDFISDTNRDTPVLLFTGKQEAPLLSACEKYPGGPDSSENYILLSSEATQ